jgi:phage terminase large subunit-like protein
MNNLNSREEEIIDRMIKDKIFRVAMARKSHFWFFHYYLGPRYCKYPTADFHREIFNLTERDDLQNILITAFRGSAKSTLITLSYVLWSIIGVKQKKFPVILGHTQLSTQIHLNALKKELEENDDFRRDFGPFKEHIDGGGMQSILLPQYGANITTRSIGQNIRGIKHAQYRPYLIICDDIEDSESVKTQENRDKLFDWLTGDVMPAGDRDTQLVFIGTPLHNDSVLIRLKDILLKDPIKSAFRQYPIVDGNGLPLWRGKFPSQELVDNEKSKCFNELLWRREYLLEIVESDEQIIKRADIQYYDDVPEDKDYRFSAVSIDPARSLKSTADCTAMVCGKLFGAGKERSLLIMPNPVNDRINTDQLITKAKGLALAMNNNKVFCRVYVEDVGFQGIITDLLKNEGVPARSISVRGLSKEDRLAAVSSLIQLGRVRFSKTGNEKLIEQILGLGKEKHDDLVDAFTMLILQMFADSNKPVPRIYSIEIPWNNRPNPGGWHDFNPYRNL